MNDTLPKTAATAASLPYIDRRSLSQAWYSALHLASDGPAPAAARDRRAAPQSAPTEQPARALAKQRLRAWAASPARATAAPVTRAGGAAGTPPIAPRSRAARASNALGRARSYPPFRTSLTIGLEKQRVQLLLRRDGGTLHVVALCSPHVADVVRRALACAGAHLRGRGEAVRASVHVIGCGGVSA